MSALIKKKICMLGTFNVGKTSLVRRYVDSMFSDAYQTTIGVKIDKKELIVDETRLLMMLWDMEGVDQFHDLRHSHLRGAAGYFLVVDVTRPKSLEYALRIRTQVSGVLPDVPGQIVLNKCDLADQWCVDDALIAALDNDPFPPIRTSAKSGDNVEHMFEVLARRVLGNQVAQRSG